MINIAELLKNAPKDLKLYSPICGHCKLSCILHDDGIRVIAHDVPFRFDKYGRFCSADDAECLLFPSDDCRTWEGWKLPVEQLFKVGDWVVKKDGKTFYGGNYAEQITLIEVDERGKRIWLSSTTYVHDDDIRLWTIQDVKDGNVLMSDKGNPFIFCEDRIHAGYHNIIAYCGITTIGSFCKSSRKECWTYGTSLKPAAKEQRDLLFAKMKEAGYEWDADKKELRKIQPHYDISNFKPFDKVLVRDRDTYKWKANFFSHYSAECMFSCVNSFYKQCIPFEGNEHLLGTTEPCGEEFINW